MSDWDQTVPLLWAVVILQNFAIWWALRHRSSTRTAGGVFGGPKRGIEISRVLQRIAPDIALPTESVVFITRKGCKPCERVYTAWQDLKGQAEQRGVSLQIFTDELPEEGARFPAERRALGSDLYQKVYEALDVPGTPFAMYVRNGILLESGVFVEGAQLATGLTNQTRLWESVDGHRSGGARSRGLRGRIGRSAPTK